MNSCVPKRQKEGEVLGLTTGLRDMEREHFDDTFGLVRGCGGPMGVRTIQEGRRGGLEGGPKGPFLSGVTSWGRGRGARKKEAI